MGSRRLRCWISPLGLRPLFAIQHHSATNRYFSVNYCRLLLQFAKNNFKRYLIECLISFVILCILVFACAFYVQNKLLFLLIFIILVLSEKICIRILAQKNIYSIIYKDLNPKFFLSVDDIKYLHLHPIYKSLGKMSLGAYQEAINICVFEIKQNSKAKDVYLANLSRIYFELDDIDALSEMCKKFELYSEKNKK